MNGQPETQQGLNSAIEEADALLNNIEPSPFSAQAYGCLRDKITSYIGQLISESVKISKRHKADLVSQNHIERASDNLVSKKRGRLNYLIGTLGGIFLGATVSNIFGMLVLNQIYTTSGIVITISTGILGAFMIAINLND